MTTYTNIERRKIHRKAKRLLGIKQYDAQDHATFLEQCISDMVDSGEATDENDAELICQLLWEEEADLYD